MSYVESATMGLADILTRLVIICLIRKVFNGQLILSTYACSIQHPNEQTRIYWPFLGLLHERGAQLANLNKLQSLAILLIVQLT